MVSNNFKRIVLIGSGSVASTLAKVLYNSGHEILEVVSRNLANAENLAQQVHAKRVMDDFSRVTQYANLYIIAVSDDAIENVVQQLPNVNGLVVHTSGSVDSSVLKSKFKNWGVFYPLQTFTKGRELDFNKIPILIYSNKSQHLNFLQEMAASIGSISYTLDDHARSHVHIAAVIINNFGNHLLVLARKYVTEYQLPPHIFQALIQETTAKALDMGSENSQTGPAKRGDLKTIEKHLEMIRSSNNVTLFSLYEIFSKSIMDLYAPKLND
ncbi:MAG: DUF2520 domain-containing protein [Chitinophagales bacterium]|nr:DUF2520 domain-containing protein [Chitinophagales bacterium]